MATNSAPTRPTRSSNRPAGRQNIASNRKARHDYSILDTYEAGIALTGTEVKSLRAGRASLVDGFATVSDDELWLRNVHIAEYAEGTWTNHAPRRARKLLMHRLEIDRIAGRAARGRAGAGPAVDVLHRRPGQGRTRPGQGQEGIRQAADDGQAGRRPGARAVRGTAVQGHDGLSPTGPRDPACNRTSSRRRPFRMRLRGLCWHSAVAVVGGSGSPVAVPPWSPDRGPGGTGGITSGSRPTSPIIEIPDCPGSLGTGSLAHGSRPMTRRRPPRSARR